jgi:hypothetical protein
LKFLSYNRKANVQCPNVPIFSKRAAFFLGNVTNHAFHFLNVHQFCPRIIFSLYSCFNCYWPIACSLLIVIIISTWLLIVYARD